MRKHTLYAITAAGCLLFDACMLVLAKAAVNTFRGPIPEIALNDYETQPDSIVSIHDICSWEHLDRMYITSAYWADGDPEMPVISDDQQTVQLGDKCGELTVTVSTSPEWINLNDAVTVTVEPQA